MFNLFWFRATSTNCGAKLHHIFLTNKFLGHFLMFVCFSYLVPTRSFVPFSIAFSHFSALHSRQLKCEKCNSHLRAKAKTRIVLLSFRARMRTYTNVYANLFALTLLDSDLSELCDDISRIYPLRTAFTSNDLLSICWTLVPCKMERCSISTVTLFHVSWNRIPT